MNTDHYKYFIIEAAELLNNLNRDIIEFEQKSDDIDLLNRLFRYAHTLKGAAQVVELNNISTLAHLIENQFSGIKNGIFNLTADRISLVLKTLDFIKKITEVVKKGGLEESIDLTDMIAQHQQIDHICSKNQKNAKSALPKAETGSEAHIDKTKSHQNLSESGQTAYKKNNKKAETANKKKNSSKDIAKKHFSGNEVARVKLSDINTLFDHASELITNTLKLEQIHSHFKKLTKSFDKFFKNYHQIEICKTGRANKDHQENEIKKLTALLSENTTTFDTSVEELHKISDSLYQLVHRARSIKIKEVSHYFKAIVRDLSIKLNKKVKIEIKGEELELDRNLIEEIREPINQIIRNCLVHGIENELKRSDMGKDPVGIIKLKFKKKGEFLHILCGDDGRGINIEQIKKVAVKKGIIDKKKAIEISDDESLYLIFNSGFTSEDMITEYAGRGVGLDIVKDKIESLQGTVSIDSTDGKFTYFSITLPLSLNMIDAFLIELSEQKYFIPLNMIEQTGFVAENEIENIAGKNAIKLNGMPVSLTNLYSVLGVEREETNIHGKPFVHLKFNHENAAFLVDQIKGVHKIFLKELGKQLKDIKFYQDGTIISGGEPVLVLNVAELFKAAVTKTSISCDKSLIKNMPGSRILAVDDSLTSRVLIGGILEAEGYDVTQAASGEEALGFLTDAKFDLLISDVEMPGINGFELAEKIRKDSNNKDLPIIIVSSLSNDEHKRRGIKVGAQAYIIKGNFDQGIFLETVKKLI